MKSLFQVAVAKPERFQIFAAAQRHVRRLRVIPFVLAGLQTALVTGLTLELNTQTLSQAARVLMIVSWGSCLVFWGAAIGAQRRADALSREVATMRQQADLAWQVDELKDQFIAAVNHELRNPVMAMMGYLDIIDMSLGLNKTERLPKQVAAAVRVGYGMRDLINSILDTRRVDQSADTFVAEAVDVQTALETTLDLLGPREQFLKGHALRITIPVQLAIWGEPVLLQQILTNLLTNAVKYTIPGTPIDVEARAIHVSSRRHARRLGESGTVEIVVRDYGLGIPPNQIPLLFNRYVRLPRDLASRTMGNGLGLHLCKVLTEAMGGRIWVESTGISGEGAAFHVQLPGPPAP